jgi:acetyl esterase/lipase
VVAHRDLAYVSGGHPRQTLDLYLLPGTGLAPLIVWIHGGAFRMGSKADHITVYFTLI